MSVDTSPSQLQRVTTGEAQGPRPFARWKRIRALVLPPLLLLIAFLALWEAGVFHRALGIEPYYVAYPSSILPALLENRAEFLRHSSLTFTEAVSGYVIGGAIGFVVGTVSGGFSLGLKAALVELVVQQIDNHLISPQVMKRTVQLHPATVMLALLAGGTIAGFWGVLLGVPAVAVAKILLSHMWSTRVLGEDVTPYQTARGREPPSVVPESEPDTTEENGVPPKERTEFDDEALAGSAGETPTTEAPPGRDRPAT
jgi:hypothetical protein